MKQKKLINNKTRPIGVFDSGLGGLTVLQQLKIELPNESYIYFGDTAHVPYGNKSKEAIIEYSQAITKFLYQKKVKMIIVACNTVSSIALKILSKEFNIPIIGVITPIESYLLSKCKHKKIGIIGTVNTIKSKAYEKKIHQLNPSLDIYSQACPLFVPLIEEGLENHQIARIITEQYLQPLIKANIDLLILGCTHYPIIKPTIQQTIPSTIKIIDSAIITAQHTKKILKDNNLIRKDQTKTSIKIYVSDQAPHFQATATKFFGDFLPAVKNKKLR